MEYHHFLSEQSTETLDLPEIKSRLSLIQSDLQEIGASIAHRKPVHIRNAILGTLFAIGGAIGAYKTSENGENPNKFLHVSTSVVATVSAVLGAYHTIRSIHPQTLDDKTNISILQEEKILLLRISSAKRERNIS